MITIRSTDATNKNDVSGNFIKESETDDGKCRNLFNIETMIWRIYLVNSLKKLNNINVRYGAIK